MNVYNQMEKLRKEIEEKTHKLQEMERLNFNVNGVWEFATEADCEGLSLKKLGTYRGNLFDGIKKYGDMSYYSLKCERVAFLNMDDIKPKKRTVHFSVKDKSIILNDEQDHLDMLSDVIPENCVLGDSNYYGCISLEWEE